MKNWLSILLLFAVFQLRAQPETLLPGMAAPDISLLNVNNKMVSFSDYPQAKGFIVIFTGNTCPYSKAYETRMIALYTTYAQQGFPVLAIDPNDPQTSPGDSFEKMKDHATSSHFNFPFLYDENQKFTMLYGPRSTPHVFVVQKIKNDYVIAYSGAIDNDTPNTDPNKTKWVEDAIKTLLAGKQPVITHTKAIGCRISWKKRN